MDVIDSSAILQGPDFPGTYFLYRYFLYIYLPGLSFIRFSSSISDRKEEYLNSLLYDPFKMKFEVTKSDCLLFTSLLTSLCYKERILVLVLNCYINIGRLGFRDEIPGTNEKIKGKAKIKKNIT